MKKTISLFFYLFSFFVTTQAKAQTYISKGAFAEMLFEQLFGSDDDNLNNHFAVNFPSPFINLQDGNFSQEEKAVNVFSFLEFNDGVSVFSRNVLLFDLEEDITRAEAVKSIIEAYNIGIITNGYVPFNDISNTNEFWHIKTAYQIDAIPWSSNFNPTQRASIEFITDLFVNIENSEGSPTRSSLNDIDNYFLPNDYSQGSLSGYKGIDHGVFNHYAKNSFTIPDIKLNLDFSHFYSNMMVEVPEEYYPILPLGRGWSHTYNSYIRLYYNFTGSTLDPVYNVVWPDGTVHIWNTEDGYISEGVFDDFNILNGNGEIEITKKDHTVYTFKLLGGLDIYYLTNIEDPNGNIISLSYEDAQAYLTKRIKYVQAPSGKRIYFEYHYNSDHLDFIEDPINRQIRFTYNENRLKNFYDAKNQETRYYYVSNDEDAPLAFQYERFLLEEVRLPEGNSIEAEYNKGKVRQIFRTGLSPIEIDLAFDYDDDVVLTSSITYQLPDNNTEITATKEFDKHGNLLTFDDTKDNIEIDYYTSTKKARLPKTVIKNGFKTDYTFDSEGNLTRSKYYGNEDNNEEAIIYNYTYDDSKLIQVEDPLGNTSSYEYDENRNLVKVIDPLNEETLFTYNSKGLLTSVTNQEGITFTYVYANDGTLTSSQGPLGYQSLFSYDLVNRLVNSNINGRENLFVYDLNDNLIERRDPAYYLYLNFYNANDNLTEIQNGRSYPTVIGYNNKDQVTSVAFGSLVTSYDYNDDGSLEKITKPSGDEFNIEYDNEGNVIEYGTITDVDYRNDNNLLSQISNSTGSVEFSYDDFGRVRLVKTVHGHQVNYEYQANNNLRSIKYPVINGLRFDVEYRYDEKSRLSLVFLETSNRLDGKDIAQFVYRKDDKLQSVNLGYLANKVHSYDDLGRIIQIETKDIDGELIFDTRLTWNIHNNITSEQIIRPQFPPGYIPGSTGGGEYYFPYTYNRNNHLESIDGIANIINDDGNTVSLGNGNASLSFSLEDRLLTFTNSNESDIYKYNPFGHRVEVRRNGTTTKYIRDVLSDNILVELDVSGNPIYYFIYSSGGMLLARYDVVEDMLSYFHGDIRGSVIAITNENKEITHHYSYKDFGQLDIIREPQRNDNRFRYVGIYGVEYENQDLYYMRARYYQPSVGRFLTQDPVWSQNLYPYSGNNPISNIDRNGKWLETVGDVASLASSGITLYHDPSIKNAALFYWDFMATFVPFLPGSYVSKVGQVTADIVSVSTKADPTTVFRSFSRRNLRTNLSRLTGSTPSGSHAHHVFPVEFESFFKNNGIEIHHPQFGAWWGSSEHLSKAKEYNQRWSDFIQKQPSQSEIYDFGREIMSSYGISTNY